MNETSSRSEVEKKSSKIKPQEQKKQPGDEYRMKPIPACHPFYEGVEKFKDQVVVITGGDSGIGRATALALPMKVQIFASSIKMKTKMQQKPKR